jgi:hypothetical protein
LGPKLIWTQKWKGKYLLLPEMENPLRACAACRLVTVLSGPDREEVQPRSGDIINKWYSAPGKVKRNVVTGKAMK